MVDLKTDYLDDILAESMGGKRKFRITKSDGSTEDVTLEDISEYTQKGSNFGAGDINNTNQEVNLKFDSGDVVDPMLATEGGFAADALKTKEAVNNCFQSVSNGKKLVASAITGKGVTTASDATFETMSANIKKISTEGIGKSQSMQYGIGGYGYTSLTYDFGKPVLGVVTFEITETGEGRTEITAMNVSGNEVAVTVHTNHGHGASGTLTITVKVKEG